MILATLVDTELHQKHGSQGIYDTSAVSEKMP